MPAARFRGEDHQMTAAQNPAITASDHESWARALPRLILVAVVSLALLFGAFYLYLLAQPLFGAILLALALGVAIIFGANRFYGVRFIFPGVAAVLVFIAFPVIYTIYLGFTNYSSFNLLTYERAVSVLTARGTVDPDSEQPFAVTPDDDGYRIWLPEAGLLSDPVALDGDDDITTLAPAPAPGDFLAPRDAVALRAGLQALVLTTPDGSELRNAGLRNFANVTPDYVRTGDDTLLRTADGVTLTADHSRGFFTTPEGSNVPPGWRVNIGLGNFERVFNSRGIRAPMVSIFIWTLVFATASVALTFAVGLTLAVILQWEHLRFKSLYRILLILPYAVPAFISILVFRGLFNQNFGEINLILNALFGIRPTWFTDGNLARVMLLIVNTWLGYPYMMLLAMGFLQSVPADHKKAAALEGASSLRVFFTITLPQIIPPFLPLLIAAFAFNFNNLVLVLLLTQGLPDIPGTVIPAGQTDILASFVYRMAFNDSSQQFGLAGAITLLIFVVVAAISYLNFVAMRRAANRRAGRV
jgi:maltose/maltodextrin transport system permease protein